ncbi:MAG: 30S ribosomal protein S7, partial [Verrucomicrobia bacterium]|nr:30S ribosomal protein S7 [Verrucomicrobiota bacterium]
MARRKRVYAKPEQRDPRYDSPLVALLVNKIMLQGKKSLSERIVYAAIDRANEKGEVVDPLELVLRAIENAKPRVEVKSRRVGGATYQVPLEVSQSRQEALAIRWIVQYARG